MLRRILSAVLAICFIFVASVPAALAAEEEKTLSLNDAISMALERNRDIKVQDLNLEKATEQLDDLRDSIQHVPATNVYIPQISSAWAGYLSAEANERIANKTFEALKQQLVVDVKEQYYDVLSKKKAIEIAQNDLKLSRIKLSQARLKSQLGMVTQADIITAEAAASSANTSLESAKNDLADSYSKLAVLIGANGVFEPELVDDAVFVKAELDSLDAVIARTLSQQYQIWAAEKLAKVAERAKEYEDNYTVAEIEAQIKEIEAGDTKEQMTKEVKSLYLSIMNLENNYVTKEQDVKKLQESLRVVGVQHDVGMATDLQVQEAEQTYKEAEEGLRDLMYQHDVAKTQLLVLTGEDVLPEEA